MFELYLTHLNPNLDRLFQQGCIASKKFNIHDFDRIILYKKQPIGEHQIPKMLPRLTEILGKPRLTNHSIRTQVIQTLVRLGFNEHEIMKFTGKKGINLAEYIRRDISGINFFFFNISNFIICFLRP